jgi:nitric oxide reductase NorE protein
MTRPAHQAIPGQPDMWVLVMIEALTFSDLFLASQRHLELGLGVANTLILLTSSWSIARCVEHSRAGDWRAARRSLLLTAGAGALFCALKLYEWSVELGQGFTFETNRFFSFYYFLTAMHLLHVLVGFIALGVIRHQIGNPARRSLELIETGATYWHLVDVLWVIIFALLYVMR